MLLVCTGPDTFRAQKKARELEQAFREKYDLQGSSMERLLPGKDGVDEVIERANTVSLFSPRRFMRAASLLSECPKGKQAALIQALSKDPENIIVVDIEEDVPTDTVWKTFSGIEKIIKYSFPLLHGAEFLSWAVEAAATLKVADLAVVRALATDHDGDNWYVWNELMKIAAGGTWERSETTQEQTIYQVADAYVRQQKRWTSVLLDQDLLAQAMTTFVSQSRAALRVRDRATNGMHPFLQKKMAGISAPEIVFGPALLTLLSQRAGLGNELDVSPLLNPR
ncbi:MAG: hypothetical protein Q7R83_01150 [bacterium]|nr:hypothetical protein [bacterium]